MIRSKITNEYFVSKRIIKENGEVPYYIRDEVILNNLKVTLLEHLTHPNIVTYKGTYEDDDYLYILLEYCQSKLSDSQTEVSMTTSKPNMQRKR